MRLKQCEICKCHLTDGEVNASQYDRYLTCFLHRNNPKITMMSCKNGKLSGNVVLNEREWVVQPFQVASDASASEKENKLIERAIRSSEL